MSEEAAAVVISATARAAAGTLFIPTEIPAILLAKQAVAADLGSYWDTLALAQIRVGKIDEAKESVKAAIQIWEVSGQSDQPKFLETKVSIAEANFEEKKSSSTDVGLKILDDVMCATYITNMIKDRISKLRKKYAPEIIPEPAL